MIREMYAEIQKQTDKHSVSELCEIYGVSRSGYYKWLKRAGQLNRYEKTHKILDSYVLDIHSHHPMMGYRQIRDKLYLEFGWIVSDPTVWKSMKRLRIHGWQAKQKCRNLVVVPPHFEEYIKYSKLARNVYQRYTDQVEPYGMDECWLDISGTDYTFGSPEKVANDIRETIKFELGLTISVGVFFNKIFAKLGSDMKKPDAVTVIPKDTFRDKIWGLPAADLLGVGRATQRVLDSYCIRTIGDLAKTDPDFLNRRLGKNGIALWQYANGNDRSRVMNADFVSPIKSVGHGITTIEGLENDEQVWPVFLELTQDIGHKLRVHKKCVDGVAIHIRDNTLLSKQWQTALDMPTQSPMLIAKAAFALFEKRYDWRNPIRLVTIQAINLVPQDTPRQVDLFMNIEKIEKAERLDQCIETIRQRFGKNSIRNGILFQNLRMPSEKPEITMPTGVLC